MNAEEMARRYAAGVRAFKASPARRAEAARAYSASMGAGSTAGRRKGGSVKRRRRTTIGAAPRRRRRRAR